MSVDKLVDSTQLDADLTSVANAIRTKGGTSAQLAFPSGFVSAIGDIQTGGGTDYSAGLLDGTISGAYENTDVTTLRAQAFAGCSNLTSVSMPNLTTAQANAFYNCTNIETLHLPLLYSATANYIFGNIKKMTTIALPSLNGSLGAFAFSGDTLLTAVDLGHNVRSISGQCFASTALSVLVLRRTDGVVSLSHINAFNGTPFASGGAGGTIYVPASLVSSYQNATNWSTLHGYGTVTWAVIEGSIYETQYADGTSVS